MRFAFAAVLAVHGLVHLLGFAKAFGLAELTALTQPIHRSTGLVWLAAGLAFVLSAGLLVGMPRAWWPLGASAVVLSQIAIALSWSDAKWGTLVNALVLVGVVASALWLGPTSLRALFEREIAQGLTLAAPAAPPTSLDALPSPVQRYLARSGALGGAAPSQIAARFHGRIRGGASAPWMTFTAEQRSFFGGPTRLFLLEARMRGLPVQVLHVYRDGAASMRVALLGTFVVRETSGDDMTHAETVTLLNDLCVLAPGALRDPAITWTAMDDTRARAAYAVGAHRVSAELVFDRDGMLVDFVSDDRAMTLPDGTLRPCRWSTPLAEPRSYGGVRVASRGEARWHPPEGAFTYLEIAIDDVA